MSGSGQSALDAQPRTSFAGLLIPSERITIHAQGRQHVHEFPHAPGGAPEKLGRGLWYLTVSANFQTKFPGYQGSPPLYPDTMLQLRQLFEKQVTDTFQHPSYGQFNAFIIAWRGVWDPKVRSGEKVELEFLEDQRSAFLNQTTQGFTGAGMSASQATLDSELDSVRDQLQLSDATSSLFDSLRAGVNAISAIGDTGNAYMSLFQAKALEVRDLSAQLDNSPEMQTPLALGIIDALHDVWASAQALATSIANSPTLATWITPRAMTIQDIAIKLYNGDVSRVSDLLSLNGSVIQDPTRVRANTTIQYFKPPPSSGR